MPLHLVKLCVGCDTISDLEAWIAEKRRRLGPSGRPGEHMHTTRMMPKRAEELLAGGSLHWVIKGQLACRQRLLDLRQFTDGEGISRCNLVLEPTVIAVAPRPVRPFQGWRYLDDDHAPADLGRAASGLSALPETLRRELVELGLL